MPMSESKVLVAKGTRSSAVGNKCQNLLQEETELTLAKAIYCSEVLGYVESGLLPNLVSFI